MSQIVPGDIYSTIHRTYAFLKAKTPQNRTIPKGYSMCIHTYIYIYIMNGSKNSEMMQLKDNEDGLFDLNGPNRQKWNSSQIGYQPPV